GNKKHTMSIRRNRDWVAILTLPGTNAILDSEILNKSMEPIVIGSNDLVWDRLSGHRQRCHRITRSIDFNPTPCPGLGTMADIDHHHIHTYRPHGWAQHIFD